MEDLKNEVVEWIGGQMKGYKGMNMDMTCRGMQYEVGGTYRVDGEVELCRNGLHFCKELVDTFSFYPLDTSRYFEVEAGGTIVTDEEGGKSAASELTVIRELPETEVRRCFYFLGGRGNYGNGYGDGCGDGEGGGYGNHGDEFRGYGDGDAYGDGGGNGRGYGDGDTYGDGEGRGDGDGEGIEYILKPKNKIVGGKIEMNICVICESGWIIKGTKGEGSDTERLPLHDASVVRRWSNGKGIGGIAKRENRDEYTLDYIGDVEIRQGKILFVIPCEW